MKVIAIEIKPDLPEKKVDAYGTTEMCARSISQQLKLWNSNEPRDVIAGDTRRLKSVLDAAQLFLSKSYIGERMQCRFISPRFSIDLIIED